MKLVRLTWALLGLGALGCPLLVDNRLQLVSESAAGADPGPVATAGAPQVEPEPTAGAPPMMDGAAGAAGAATVPTTCGEVSVAEPGAACPSVCDRCEQGYCIFECSDDETCKDGPLDCPAGWACRVSCSAPASCNKARINCPADFSCEVECAEVDSCKEAVVTCASGNCQVRCDVDKACEKTKVTCSTGHCAAQCLGPMQHPMVVCGPACACEPC